MHRAYREAFYGDVLMKFLLVSAGLATLTSGLTAAAPVARTGYATTVGELTSTGQRITPRATPGAVFTALNPNLPELPDFTAGQAASLALSPDGKTLLVLTSGFNRNFGGDGKPIPATSHEYVFVYDVSGPLPVKRQVLQPANTFEGLAWAPKGDRFFVSGGTDDAVLEYVAGPAGFALARTLKLGHKSGVGLSAKPHVSGVAVSPDGRSLLVANYQNDSVSLIDLPSGTVMGEQDLRPGVINPAKNGTPGGSFPRGVVWTSTTRAYVGSQRDREVIALDIDGRSLTVATRIKVRGQPGALIVNAARDRLYAALDNSDGVAVIDPARGTMVEAIDAIAPAGLLPKTLGGAGIDHLALSPDERTLFVSEGGLNAVSVVTLGDPAIGPAAEARAEARGGDGPERSSVIGLIPTGWYPTGVAVRPDGRHLYVINGKSVPGPNPSGCRNTLATGSEDKGPCRAAGEYVWQLQKAGLLTLPMPSAHQLASLTVQVAHNNGADTVAERRTDAMTMAFLHRHIRHVIYVVKENRSYDQVLGDLGVGNGDPSLTLLPEALSPNHHALARQFVTLDAFLDSGESSNTGWNWTTAARTNDFAEREAPINYAGRGLQYDHEGNNRNINMGLATVAARKAANPATPDDPNILPGTADVAAPDGPDGAEGQGYLWDSAIRAGVSVRNYGFYGDLTRYFAGALIPLDREPFKTRRQVFYPSKAALLPVTDPYYRGFDQAFPDFWRFKEWEREFDGYAARGNLPGLSLVRLPHDHFGSFDKAIDGVNTVETQMADNDYALGMLVEKVARSRYAADTLIFVVEDDAQDGADHVDAHRSIAFVVGPYVRRRAVVSNDYNTVSMLKTIEMVMGMKPMGLTDALARPMTALFDVRGSAKWDYRALVPDVLRTTQLPIGPATRIGAARATCPNRYRSAAYWTKAMTGQNFDLEDHLDAPRFNAALWTGLKPDANEVQTMGQACPAVAGRR